QVEALASAQSPRIIAAGFDERIRRAWPLAEVGFCVTLSGDLLAPLVSASSRKEAQVFFVDNAAFLSNAISAEVYWNAAPTKGANYSLSKQQGEWKDVKTYSDKTPPSSSGQSGMNSAGDFAEKNSLNSNYRSRMVNPVQQQSAVGQPPDAAKDEQA